jgi:hypothetical protein
MGQRPLMDYLSLSSVSQVTEERGFLGGTYIRLYNYFWVLSFLYESGAILGRARRDKLSILEKMLFPGGNAPSFLSVKVLQDKADERLYRYRQRFGKEPDTFGEFIFERELQIATGLNLTDSLEAFERGNKKALKPFDKKVPLEKAGAEWGKNIPIEKTQAEIRMFVAEGIGFGSLFPELTEGILRNYYESIQVDMDAWHKERKTNLTTPQKPKILSLEEQEETILKIVAECAKECYPELLGPLDLRRYQKVDLFGYDDWSRLVKFLHDDIYIGRGYLVKRVPKEKKSVV